jgi:hypothetical protein
VLLAIEKASELATGTRLPPWVLALAPILETAGLYFVSMLLLTA